MEINILDSLYRRTEVVDVYESFIWTERFAEKGDFELKLLPTIQNQRRFIPGTRISIHESYRVMSVETSEVGVDEEGARFLIVKGFSLEYVLEQRLAMASLDIVTDPQWILEGTPKEIATQMFHDICVTGILNAGDVIDGVNEVNIFPADTIAEPPDDIIYIVDPMTLYQGIKDLADTYFMGFRLVRDHDTTQLYFDVYMGVDRTTQQSTHPAVIFSPDLENLESTRKLESSAQYKNVAYVVSPVGSEIVYLDDVDPGVEGFERRVLLVKADDIEDPVPADATAKMIQRGKQELAKNRRFIAIDGEVTENSKYVYGTHFTVGDYVTMQEIEGTTARMQVTEYIFISDKEGKRSYPTLSIAEVVTPGSWLAVPPTLEWDDMTTEEWADM